MDHPQSDTRRSLRRLRAGVLATALAWTAILCASMLWWAAQSQEQALSLARKDARANFDKDTAFRKWATGHGGVYVPATEHTPPNPYLDHIEERDLTTPSGRQLTLMNPAYMVRQLMEEFSDDYGVRGHITSLNPLNPDNAPGDWERRALEAFEQGTQEVFEIVEEPEGRYLRLMRPMVTEEGCLKCHEHQGYAVGDIRGGVGVSIPMQGYERLTAEQRDRRWLTHGATWLLGLIGIGVAGRIARQRIRERNVYQERIWQQANFDVLTGLGNRHLFGDRLQQAVGRAAQRHRPLALLFVDLDHFKDVNDSRGHAQGDDLLSLAAARLRSSVGADGVVSRIGGDEFTVLLEEQGDVDTASAVAQRIREACSAPFQLPDGLALHLSASIGVALYPDDGDDGESLLRCADAAMYQAKRDGRNAVRFYDPAMTREVERRLLLEQQLWRGLEYGEFVLHFQPVFAAVDRQPVGAEALLRWQHAEDGLVYPDRFIAVAERSGLIVPLGEWVLRSALAQLECWERMGFGDLGVMVNVSTVQCRHEGFRQRMADIAASVPPQRLRRVTLEITESLYLGATHWARSMLSELRDLGFRVVIDDFGTGYSSLAYLKNFPLDGLKIDRDFVRGIADSRRDAALCQSIIHLAHELDMSVVAEGVETEEQLRMLRLQGCDRIQGFLLGRPETPEALEERLGRIYGEGHGLPLATA